MTPLETITKRLEEIEARASRVKPDRLEVERVGFDDGEFAYEVRDAYDRPLSARAEAREESMVQFNERNFRRPMQAKFHAELYAHSRTDIPALVAALKVAVESIKIMHYECADGCETVNQIAAALGGEDTK